MTLVFKTSALNRSATPPVGVDWVMFLILMLCMTRLNACRCCRQGSCGWCRVLCSGFGHCCCVVLCAFLVGHPLRGRFASTRPLRFTKGRLFRSIAASVLGSRGRNWLFFSHTKYSVADVARPSVVRAVTGRCTARSQSIPLYRRAVASAARRSGQTSAGCLRDSLGP